VLNVPGVSPGDQEDIYSTGEGLVVITTRGKLVFVAESFPLPLARKLTALVLDAQGGGEMRMARWGETESAPTSVSARAVSGEAAGQPGQTLSTGPLSSSPLSADLVRFFQSCGVLKAVVDASLRAAH
jgi:hypothetical protein